MKALKKEDMKQVKGGLSDLGNCHATYRDCQMQNPGQTVYFDQCFANYMNCIMQGEVPLMQ
jgi:hypothetical protein